MTPRKNLTHALGAWKAALGAEHVNVDEKRIDEYCRDVTPFEPKASAVLTPGSTENVRKVVKIASKFGIPLHPISRGYNWGYGATCPIRDGHVVVDLRRLNQIEEINDELAYAVIGPGVTQAQLSGYLKKNHPTLMLDVTAGPPEASVIGNILERGIGYGRYADHFAASCAMHVVLADGRLLKTGFDHFNGAVSTHVSKGGVGPLLDGLFTQSNFGIVTRMTVWLTKRPETLEAFFFQCRTKEEMLKALMVLRDLKLEGTITSNIHLGSLERIGSIANNQKHVMAWSGASSLEGTRGDVAARKKRVTLLLKNSGVTVRWLTLSRMKLLERFPGLLQALSGARSETLLPLLQSTFFLLNGIPTSTAIKGLYGCLNRAVEKPTTPVADGCGYYWFSPVIPCQEDILARALTTYEDIFRRAGFSFQATLQMPGERAVIAVLSIGYDKQNQQACKKAAACYADLIAASKKQGLYPYRTGLGSGSKYIDRGDLFWDVLNKFKRAIDPKNIITPGRWKPG